LARLYTDKGAILSKDGIYRYLLWRHWGPATLRCLFVMLNPSTADANVDDPTINRVVGFASDWGFDGVEIVNAYAYRATQPKALYSIADPIGPDNEIHVRIAAAKAPLIVAGWGTHGATAQDRIVEWVGGKPIFALRINADNSPGHPLYVPASEPLKLYA
jgi:hypothetical protein